MIRPRSGPTTRVSRRGQASVPRDPCMIQQTQLPDPRGGRLGATPPIVFEEEIPAQGHLSESARRSIVMRGMVRSGPPETKRHTGLTGSHRRRLRSGSVQKTGPPPLQQCAAISVARLRFSRGHGHAQKAIIDKTSLFVKMVSRSTRRRSQM